MKKLTILLAGLFLLSISHDISADEGMWLVNLMEKGLIRDMRAAGFQLEPEVIYDENAASISDAVIALDFFCTGSIISDRGLLITNHHCAYSDVHAISTTEKNYLEDGFWAMNSEQEIPIPGRSAYFLRKVIDVTAEVGALLADHEAKGQKLGGRKLSYLIEKKYSAESGMEASLGNMWSGSAYYIFLYERFADVRLVAAPPVSIAAFGGDIDNWEWPQHKGDFAMYRVYSAPDGTPAGYSAENIPMVPKRHLAISTKGVKMGDFTMILGYPGRTDRYSSSFEADFRARVEDPLNTAIWKEKMEIIRRWSEKDDAIRLKYADQFFSMSNIQENKEGEMQAIRRYGVVEKKKALERELQQWLDERDDPRKGILKELEASYGRREPLERELHHYREGIIRSTVYFTVSSRIRSTLHSLKRHSAILIEDEPFMKWAEKFYQESDPGVELEKFTSSVKYYLAGSSPAFRGEIFNEMYRQCGNDATALARYIWENSSITGYDKFLELVSSPVSVEILDKDPLIRFFQSTSIKNLNDAMAEAEGQQALNTLSRTYTQALYRMRTEKGIPCYPDANSTMRLTYGEVCDLSPRDGVRYGEISTTKGILEKYTPAQYEFRLDDRQKGLLQNRDWGRWGTPGTDMPVDFLSTNDITGGNSGSPVLNAQGELIGLAFDGNKESLCSDVWFEPPYCKCVNVDIRYVLWILDRYAGMSYLLDEMELR